MNTDHAVAIRTPEPPTAFEIGMSARTRGGAFYPVVCTASIYAPRASAKYGQKLLPGGFRAADGQSSAQG